MDALEFLTQDHRSVERLFRAYERTSKGRASGESSSPAKLFPRLRRLMDGTELALLGEAMEEARKTAPTHPHRWRRTPHPENVVSDALAKILDSGKDLVRGTARSATRAVTAHLTSAAEKELQSDG